MIHRARFVAIALLTPLTVTTAVAPAPPSSQSPRCASKVGAVLGYDPDASDSCSPRTLVAQPLYAGETVRSGSPGDFTFQTGHLKECIQLPAPNGTADILRPRAGIALKHLHGTTWCEHAKSDTKPRTLRTPGAVIRLHGTTFGIESNGRSSTVKVSGGSLTAISTFSGRYVTINSGHQAVFPINSYPSKLGKLKPTTIDAKALALLSVGATPMGIPEVLQSLQNEGTKAAILVALDSSTLNTVGPQLGSEGISYHGLLDSALQSNPSSFNTFAAKLHTQTAVVATPAVDARQVLDDVRNAAPKFLIIFFDTQS